MSTTPVVHKPATEAHKAATSKPETKQPEPPKKTVDPDKVYRADGSEDTNATKERKLKKIASKRVPKAIVALRMVGQLGAYKPNPEQQAKILNALRQAFTEMERRLSITVVKTEDSGFVL